VPKTAKSCFSLIVVAAAHPRNTFLRNIKVLFLPANCISLLEPIDLVITHAFKHHYRKQLIQKAVATVDGGLPQDATNMKLDVLWQLLSLLVKCRYKSPSSFNAVKYFPCQYRNNVNAWMTGYFFAVIRVVSFFVFVVGLSGCKYKMNVSGTAFSMYIFGGQTATAQQVLRQLEKHINHHQPEYDTGVAEKFI
jgi:hypothetical protein